MKLNPHDLDTHCGAELAREIGGNQPRPKITKITKINYGSFAIVLAAVSISLTCLILFWFKLTTAP